MDHQQDDTDDEENPCDLRGDGCHACGTEHPRNQPDNQEYKA